MDKNNVVVLSEEFPIPTRSIWELIEYASEYPMQDNSAPEPGYERLVRARDTVAAWMSRVEYELGYPMVGDDRKLPELHPDQAKIGVCPFCHVNDRSLTVGEECWGLCHTHQVRWLVPAEKVSGNFTFDGTDFWDAGKTPLHEYAVVSPAWLLDGRKGDAGAISWVKAVVRKLFPRAGQLSTHP